MKGGKHLDDMMVPLNLLCLESALLLVLKLSEVINFLIDKQAYLGIFCCYYLYYHTINTDNNV